MLSDSSVEDKDKQFALSEVVDKTIGMPLEDFVKDYQKFRLEAQNNERNIRVNVPRQFSKMLVNMAQREVDKVLFERVCEAFVRCMSHTERNSSRLFSQVLKDVNQFEGEYKQIVAKTALGSIISQLSKELTSEIPDANKNTV